MKTIVNLCDNETVTDHTLTFQGMPTMADLNRAGADKFGYAWLKMTITSMTTE